MTTKTSPYRRLAAIVLRGGGAPAERRAAVVAALLAVQAVCAVFFVGDVLADIVAEGYTLHLLFEAAVALALALGIAFTGLEMRRTLARMRRAEAASSAASGAFAALVQHWFETWGLTAAEADVALFTLKGLDAAAIAALREASPGTVRAQLTRVYAKAGVSSRGEFVSLFVDALLEGPLAYPDSGR